MWPHPGGVDRHPVPRRVLVLDELCASSARADHLNHADHADQGRYVDLACHSLQNACSANVLDAEYEWNPSDSTPFCST
jgi:hypothetical protein